MTPVEARPWQALARAWGGPAVTGVLRAQLTDFCVEELLGFEPDGEGEHRLVQIEKRGLTTPQVAQRLAGVAGVPPRDVGYAGLKDKHAVTSQWFTTRVAKREPDWRAFDSEACRIVAVHPHRRKLRRGALEGNRFQIRVRELAGDAQRLDAILRMVAERGAPNYFGPQRFGRRGDNLATARRWFETGHAPRRRLQRSMALSAARSQLFNAVLDRRVRDGSWCRFIAGDLAGLDGSRSVFAVTADDPELPARLAALDVHPTGPLWGRSDDGAGDLALALEAETVAAHSPLPEGIVAAGATAARRQLRIAVRDLDWDDRGEELQVEFRLPAGAYATSVLREAVDFDN